MSSSPARLAANAANAQHSTGPRTPEGKARSSQNARTHGPTARDLIIAPDEREEFEELLNDYQTGVKPQDAIQRTLFDELSAAAWNLRRMEVQLCSDTALEDEQLQIKLDRLARHKRTFHRNLNDLKALQTNAIIEATLPRPVRQHVLPPSNAIEISKRTQHFGPSAELRLFESILQAPPPGSACRAAT